MTACSDRALIRSPKSTPEDLVGPLAGRAWPARSPRTATSPPRSRRSVAGCRPGRGSAAGSRAGRIPASSAVSSHLDVRQLRVADAIGRLRARRSRSPRGRTGAARPARRSARPSRRRWRRRAPRTARTPAHRGSRARPGRLGWRRRGRRAGCRPQALTSPAALSDETGRSAEDARAQNRSRSASAPLDRPLDEIPRTVAGALSCIGG